MFDIAKQNTVTEMLAARRSLLDAVRQLRELEAEIDRLGKPLGIYYYQIQRNYFRETETRQYIDRKLWETVARETLYGAMTEKAKEDFLRTLEQHPPEFTAENLEEIARSIEGIYRGNVEQTIFEVYTALIGAYYYGSHGQKKRDNLQEIKPQFRINEYIRFDPDFKKFRIGYGGKCLYEDLYTACKLLDGKSRYDYTDTFQAIAEAQLKNGADTVATRYFSVKCYKNGNQLVTFSNDAIREQLNKIGSRAAGNALPDHMAKRYKPEHFENSPKMS